MNANALKILLFGSLPAVVVLAFSSCGDDEAPPTGAAAQEPAAKGDPGKPSLIPCSACKELVFVLREECAACGCLTPRGVESRKWAKWEASSKPFGGPEALAKIREAKESAATVLHLNGHQISDLTPLGDLAKLTELHLGGNQVTDISVLAGCVNLARLHLGGNQVTDLTPLAKLTSLTILSLGGNQVTDLAPLAGLTQLSKLDLPGNQIEDVSPLMGLASLRNLSLFGNKITAARKAMLQQALPNCKIVF